MDNVKDWLSRFCKGYVRFVEKQGFMVILFACIAVIAGTAVWTSRTDTPRLSPTPPISDVALAAQLDQESLEDVATPSPTVAPTPRPLICPLDEFIVLQGFDNARLKRSDITGLWRLHDAVDLLADVGDLVASMADGVVLATSEEGIQGAWVEVSHEGDISALYAGMQALGGIRPGDPVRAGQTLGFVGNGMMDETDLPAHLHLRITRNGRAIDPLTVLLDN